MARKPTRRDFLKYTGLTGAGFWIANNYGCSLLEPVPQPRRLGPNDKLHVASIGIGGMGNGDLNSIAGQGAEIVALCDPHRGRDEIQKNRKKFSKAKFYTDFRVMFDQMEKDIDAVSISTPDHTHAVATMAAMKRGKHVYTQKPLTHDVYEARMLTEAAKKYGVVTQMGNQGTASDGLRTAVEVVQSGALGPVREVHVWTNRAGTVWPQGVERPTDTPPAPEGLDWDNWIGTAPMRPYHSAYMPFRWRGWCDFGTGALGDMACHTANMAFMACKLGYPDTVECMEMSEFNGETFPLYSVIRYEFPAREEMPPLKWTWYDGGNDKPNWVVEKLKQLIQGEKLGGSGSVIVGDKGSLYSPSDYGDHYTLLPREDFVGHRPPAPWLPRVGGDHYGEWYRACLACDPTKTTSNFGYAGPLTETVVLGCVAMRSSKRIDWDGPNMRITNDRDANQWLKREYRKGWSL